MGMSPLPYGLRPDTRLLPGRDPGNLYLTNPMGVLPEELTAPLPPYAQFGREPGARPYDPARAARSLEIVKQGMLPDTLRPGTYISPEQQGMRARAQAAQQIIEELAAAAGQPEYQPPSTEGPGYARGSTQGLAMLAQQLNQPIYPETPPPPPPIAAAQPESFTLRAGETRFGPTGQEIARAEAPPAQARTLYERLGPEGYNQMLREAAKARNLTPQVTEDLVNDIARRVDAMELTPQQGIALMGGAKNAPQLAGALAAQTPSKQATRQQVQAFADQEGIPLEAAEVEFQAAGYTIL